MTKKRRHLYLFFILLCLTGLLAHLLDFTSNSKPVWRQANFPWANYHLGAASADLLRGRLVPFKKWSTAELAALPGLGTASAQKARERGYLTEHELEKTKGYLLP